MLQYASALFISDLHLDAATAGAAAQADHANLAAFVRLCTGLAREADALFILGDLFEAYVGDNDLVLYPAVVHALEAYRQTGRRLHFLHGNRDFLVGAGFCRATGATLLEDPCVVEIGGRRIGLSHGDAWCTDDTAYQTWRATARNPAWQAAFLAKPLVERHAIARGLRVQSESAKEGKSKEIMDVNDAAVQASAAALGVDTLIHGHTHRPADHRMVRGAGAPLMRHVLSDWQMDAASPRGDALHVNSAGIERIALAAP